MARMNAQLVALNRGEVSKLALAHVDLEKLRLAADCQLNWEPRVIGPMGLRPGLPFVGEIANDNPALPLDFIYAKNDTALIELTNNLMRVWINDVLLARPSVATAISDPNFNGGGSWSLTDSTAGTTATISGGTLTLIATPLGSLARAKQAVTVASGDRAKEHGLRVTVTNGPVTVRIGSTDGLFDILGQTSLDTGVHSLSFVPNAATFYLQIDSTDQWQKTLDSVAIEAAGVVTLPTPWATADLPNVRWTQSGDILYVAAYGMQQRMIQRRGVRPGARGWSVVLYRSGDGPFHEGPDADITLTPAQIYGNTTITASQPFFAAGHVGALLRLFTPQQFNLAPIGGDDQFTFATRLSGLQGDRNLSVHVTGTWVGTWTLQRSIVGPDEGFVHIQSSDSGWPSGSQPDYTANYSNIFNDDKTTAAGNAYDNVIAWYRLGFDVGNYTSGVANMQAFIASGGGWGICRITAVNSPTSVNVEVLVPFTAAKAATDWQISDWCDAYGWPTSVCFAEDRLFWFSGGTIPVAGSLTNNYYSYAEEDQFGNEIGDSGAILEAFGEGPSDTVSWGLPLSRLLAGRELSIASIRSSSFDTPLTPNDFAVKDCSTQGAARMRALKVDKRGVYLQGAGRKVYLLEFDAQATDYTAHDLTRLNLDVGKPGFTGNAIARQPDTFLYWPRNDGQCASLLYDPDDDVIAWTRMQTLGIFESSPCVLPNPDGPDDFVYFVVNRTVGGVTKRFLEKLAPRDNCAGGLVNQLLDSHIVYQGAPATTITLPHLPSTSVQIWADGLALGAVTTDGSGVATLPNGASASNIVAGLGGAVVAYEGDPATTLTGLSAYNGLPCEIFADQQPRGHMVHLGAFTVSGGVVTLPANLQASSIVAFFGFTAPFMSAKLTYAAQGGSALSMKKKIDHLGLLLFDAHAQGLQFGQRFDQLDDLPQVEDGATVTTGTVWSEYDAPMTEVPGEWDTDSRLCLLGQAPFPVKVGAVVVGIETEG